MIRPFTIITMMLAALSGAYLFAVKHRAQVLDDQIAAYSQNSRLDAMRIRVLQGQWSLETDPTRLQQLAAQFTALQPMQPAQLVTLAALRESLPPAGSTAVESNPALPDAAPQLEAVAQNSASLAPSQISAGALPLPPREPPVRLAGFAPLRPEQRIAHRTSHSSLHLADTELAEALPPARPFYAPKPPRVAARPMANAVQTVPMGAQVMSVKATAMVPQYVSPPQSGSALGMADNLPPAQPMPANGNDN